MPPPPGSPTASAGEPLDFSSEVPAPRVRAKDVLLYVAEDSNGSEQFFPRFIKMDSPRFSGSMVDNGVEMWQLGNQPEEGPYGSNVGSAGRVVARKRIAAWEALRQKNLGIVLRARDAKVEQDIRDEEARKKANSGFVQEISIAAQLEEQRSAMIVMAEAQAKATGEAMQRRMSDVQKQIEDERALAKNQTKKQHDIMVEFEKRKVEQRKKTAAQRKSAQLAQLERERTKAERYEAQQEEKASKLWKYAEADAVREAEAAERREELRKRQLAFARKHERKIARIKAEAIVKEEERAIMGEATAVKVVASEKVRMERVAARKEAVAAEHAERSVAAAIRLEKHIADVNRTEEELKVAAAQKEVKVSVRVAENKQKIAVETEKQRAIDRKKGEVIAKKLLMGEKHRKAKALVLAAAAEEKDAVIVEAQKRREKSYVVRAEDSRLKFAGKRDFVDRKKRLEDAARWKREEKVLEKDHYTNEVIRQKKQYVAMRRDMAIHSMVEVRSLFDQAKENRPSSADPTVVEVRAAELKKMQMDLSSVPGGSAPAAGRGVLSVAAPSKSNGWIGEVESSIELQPFASVGGASQPVSAGSVTSTRSMPEMGRTSNSASMGEYPCNPHHSSDNSISRDAEREACNHRWRWPRRARVTRAIAGQRRDCWSAEARQIRRG